MGVLRRKKHLNKCLSLKNSFFLIILIGKLYFKKNYQSTGKLRMLSSVFTNLTRGVIASPAPDLTAGLLWDCPTSQPRGGGRNRHQRAAEHRSDRASLIFNVVLMNCSAVLLDLATSHGETAELSFPFNWLKLTFSFFKGC